MRRSVVVISVVVLFLVAVGCGKKDGAGAVGQAGTDAQLAGQLKPANVTPAKPLDQSAPKSTLLCFFEAVNTALDPAFQAASREPDVEPMRAEAYFEARTRLRGLFVDRDPATQVDPNTEVVAYLDTIQIKRAEIIGEPTVDGQTAKVKVRIVKGVAPEADPRYFGEDSDTEATVEVVLTKIGDKWKIKDFGGLVARAVANAPRM